MSVSFLSISFAPELYFFMPLYVALLSPLSFLLPSCFRSEFACVSPRCLLRHPCYRFEIDATSLSEPTIPPFSLLRGPCSLFELGLPVLVHRLPSLRLKMSLPSPLCIRVFRLSTPYRSGSSTSGRFLSPVVWVCFSSNPFFFSFCR